jgi:hypothetical protein
VTSYNTAGVPPGIPTLEEVLAIMREQGITDLDDVIQKALQVAQEEADKNDEPAHAVTFLHEHFCFFHSEGVVL